MLMPARIATTNTVLRRVQLNTRGTGGQCVFLNTNYIERIPRALNFTYANLSVWLSYISGIPLSTLSCQLLASLKFAAPR